MRVVSAIFKGFFLSIGTLKSKRAKTVLSVA
jgi:hypothetical protein